MCNEAGGLSLIKRTNRVTNLGDTIYHGTRRSHGIRENSNGSIQVFWAQPAKNRLLIWHIRGITAVGGGGCIHGTRRLINTAHCKFVRLRPGPALIRGGKLNAHFTYRAAPGEVWVCQGLMDGVATGTGTGTGMRHKSQLRAEIPLPAVVDQLLLWNIFKFKLFLLMIHEERSKVIKLY